MTGGAGFIGSHVAQSFAEKGKDYEVICYDNLSRSEILKRQVNTLHNWNYLKKFHNIKLVKGDIRDFEKLKEVSKDIDVIVHAAAQTAVTTSLQNPRIDFEINLLGTFNILEIARLSHADTTVIYCSTNKVYGSNVNKIKIVETDTRYMFEDVFKDGIPEDFPIDLCAHTPYGCSKAAADLYVQDYAYVYGLKTGVFRMSCIYGPRQFGVEDQGWVAWFAIATLLGKPITIYGDGKQVRDILYVDDLIKAFDLFINNNLKHEVFNIGGGPSLSISLLELLDLLQKMTQKRTYIKFNNWRPYDQKVYISNISKIKKLLGWQPKITIKEGIEKLLEWISQNRCILN